MREYRNKSGRWYVYFSDAEDETLIMRFGRKRMFRSHFVYCMTHGLSTIPDGFELHHVNGDKGDDSSDNLILLTISEHSKVHKASKSENAKMVHTGRVCSTETKEKMAVIAKARGNNGAWGTKTCHSKSTIEKMSDKASGESNPMFRGGIDSDSLRESYVELCNLSAVAEKYRCSVTSVRNMVNDMNDGVDLEFSEVLSIDESMEEDVYDIQMSGRNPSFVANGIVVHNCGMQQLLKDLNCSSFDTATDTTALFRPGSLNSGQTSQYVKISRGDEYEHYETELLRPILSPTKGVLVYQEQIMQIFVQLGGFSWAGADKMRKIIGKKLGKDEFEKHRKGFVEGCMKNGIDETASSSLFDKMAEFAAYSFNKCIRHDAIVEYADGSSSQIKDVKSGDVLKSYNPESKSIVSNTVKSVTHSGKKRLLKITTKSGKTIFVTHEHRMFKDDYVEVHAGSLSVGDRLMVTD